MESIVSTKIFKKLIGYCFLFVFLLLVVHIIFYIQMRGVREAIAEQRQVMGEQSSKGQDSEKIAALNKTVNNLEKTFGMPLVSVLQKLQGSDKVPQKQDIINAIMQQARDGGATINIQSSNNPQLIRAVWQGDFAGFEGMLQNLKDAHVSIAVQQINAVPQKEGWSFEFELLML